MISNSNKQDYDNLKHYGAINDIVDNLVDPPAVFRSAPLWTWNDDITKQGIDEQLKEFKNVGMGGVFVHPRPGLITEYLSDEWFQLFQYAVESAKKLGMYVWIYDENSYPSGFAGGHVPAEMPESYENGSALDLKIVSELLVDSSKTYRTILKKEGASFVNITNSYKNSLGEKGEFYLFELIVYPKGAWFGGESYVDLLFKGVTDKFLDVTIEKGYKKYSSHEFGKTVPGVFTDEPNIGHIHLDLENAVTYTHDLFEVFSERWGYSLEDNLPLLFNNIGEYEKVRHNYYQILLDLFIDRWSKPCHDYYEKNNLIWTGHYWEHGWPNPRNNSDNMAMYSWHNQPAIDLLFNQFDEEDVYGQFGNIRSVKEVASVANQRGNTRVLCESFGGSGWDVSHKELKRLTDWQMVLGVNYINQHMARWTLRGARKNDYPPSFSYHNTNWNTYKTIGDYTARLSLALSSGKQINDILIIEPTTTAWTIFMPIDKYDHPPHWDVLRGFGNTFQQFVTKMEKNQIEYDLGSEYIMREWGSVEGNKLVVGERSYSKVVLPPGINNLNSETFNLLKEYLIQGGVVYSFNDKLGLIDGVKSDEINKLAVQYPSQWKIINSSEIDTSIFNDEDLVFEELPSTGKFYHHRRVLENGELLFLVNSDMYESATGKIKVKKQDCYELDLNTGEVNKYPCKIEGDSMIIDFSLNPAGSSLLYLGDKMFDAEVKDDLSGEKIEIPTSEIEIKLSSLNVLYIDYMDLKVGDKHLTDVYYYNAMDSLYNSFDFEEGNPWCRSVQYKTNTLDRNILLADNDGFELTYKFKVTDQMTLSNNPVKKLVIEAPELFSVYVNGNLINRISDEWYLDKSFGVYSLEDVVVNGINTVELKASKMNIHAEIQPVYVLGDFNVDAIDIGWEISNGKNITLGTWDEQGAPFYPNEVEYKSQFTVDSLKNKYTVECANWSGAQAIVKVNNKTSGILGWEGKELNITDFVVLGENNISIEVYGTLKNTVGPFHDFVEGFAGPLHWKDAPAEAPSGKEYKFAKYGLKSDFRINKIIPLD